MDSIRDMHSRVTICMGASSTGRALHGFVFVNIDKINVMITHVGLL